MTMERDRERAAAVAAAAAVDALPCLQCLSLEHDARPLAQWNALATVHAHAHALATAHAHARVLQCQSSAPVLELSNLDNMNACNLRVYDVGSTWDAWALASGHARYEEWTDSLSLSLVLDLSLLSALGSQCFGLSAHGNR